MQRGERLLQNEVGSRLEGFLGGRLPIYHSKGYGAGIALGPADGLQEIEAVLQVVAVDDDPIELALCQQIVTRSGLRANL